MSEQAMSGTSAERPDHVPAPATGPARTDPARADPPLTGPAPADPQAHRKHRVVRSEDLPRFSIGTPIAVGMVIWLVLLAAAIWRRDALEAAGHGWWIWTAVTGVVLGLLGWLYITVRLKDQPGQVVEPGSPVEPGSAG